MGLFQILEFTDNFSGIGVNLMNGVYVIVAKLYNFMLEISRATSVDQYSLAELIEGVTKSFYTIAGIFMLFRLTISVFGYIIDPDKLTDSKAGGTKILLNVLLTMMLLILFYPTGVVYSALSKFENAFLYSDSGFFNSIFSGLKSSSSKDYDNNIKINDNYKVVIDDTSSKVQKDLFAIDSVNAAKNLTCYYAAGSGDDRSVYSVTLKRNSENKVTGISSFSVPSNMHAIKKLNDTINNKVVKSCSDVKIGSANPGTNSSPYCLGQGKTVEVFTSSSQVSDCYTYSQGGSTNKMFDKKSEAKKSVDTSKLHYGLPTDAIMFANSVEGSFFSCVNEGDSGNEDKVAEAQKKVKKEKDTNPQKYDGETCWEFEHVPLSVEKSPSKAFDLIKGDRLDYYWFFGVILGLALSIYIIVLCVEVIIRNLKLILFQMIAPIPIINGIDPNDKMRSRWLKAYFGAYLDLFMKVFAIQLLARLVDTVAAMGDAIGTMGKIFYLVALFTFAKMVPNLISKILGIEGLAGSAKEASGMLKKGLGVGAGVAGATVGATIGAAVGFGTASGTGRVLGMFKGLSQGAKSGYKKDVFGGSKKVAASNKRDADIDALAGRKVGWWEKRKEELTGTLGLQSGYAQQKELLDKAENDINERAYMESGIADAKKQVGIFEDKVENDMKNKSGEKGFENIAEVKSWKLKRTSLDRANGPDAFSEAHMVGISQNFDYDTLKNMLMVSSENIRNADGSRKYAESDIVDMINTSSYSTLLGEKSFNRDKFVDMMRSDTEASYAKAADAAKVEARRRVEAGTASDDITNAVHNMIDSINNINPAVLHRVDDNGDDLWNLNPAELTAVWDSSDAFGATKKALKNAENTSSRMINAEKARIADERRALERSVDKIKHDAFYDKK